MKVIKIITNYLLAGSALLTILSCTREEWNAPAQENSAGIPVSLSLSVAEMDAGTPETKAIMEPDIDSPTLEQQIKNLVVLQFEGSGNDAKLVALPKYYKDAACIFDGTEKIRLLPSNTTNTIVVVANTFDNIYAQSGMTLQQFQEWTFTRMNHYESVFTRDTDGNDYLRMSGSATEEQITTSTSINLSLKRNVSKITIKVTKEDADVTLHHVQLKEINAKYYYLTNINEFKDNYSDADPCRIDKEQQSIAEEGIEDTDGSYTFTYYVPANLRGKSNSTAQYTKGLGAPKGATRFCLYGTYGSGENKTDINYTYYLGENLVDDFNLKPNYHYTYNIKVFRDSKDNVQKDYRIEDCKEVKFMVDANCYMVQPPVGQGQSRVYAIPVHRIATFWNKKMDENDGIYGARGNNPSLLFNNGSGWNAEVLWSDFVLDPADFLVTKEGVGYNDFFKIRVKEGMRGNVVVAVKNGQGILWSWHLWITDYNPDNEKISVVSGTYIYGVEGGHVHRYNNDAFNSGIYESGFIMDRNLGASSATYQGLNGTMYYQFGRKDPFVGFNQDGKAQTYYTYDDNGHVTETGVSSASSGTVLSSVSNPTTFILGSTTKPGWTSNDELGPNNSIWLDGKYDQHASDNQQALEIRKSIYDPCPPGWKVPTKVFYEDLIRQSKVEKTSDGFNYYPKGINDKSVAIYYPQHTYIDYTNAKINSIDLKKNNGKLWCSTPNNEGTASYALDFKTVISASTQRQQAFAFPVRCVREGAYVRENYIAD